MTDADRTRVTCNLDSSFITEDENGIPVPKTANAAIMSVETYLRLTQPPEGDPRALLHKQKIMSMRQSRKLWRPGRQTTGRMKSESTKPASQQHQGSRQCGH